MINGILNLRKTKQDIIEQRNAEITDEKWGERIMRETRPGKIMAAGLQEWRENKDKKVEKKNILAGMDILDKKFYLDCNRLEKNNKANLYRRLTANKTELIYIIECLMADEKIDVHNFKYKIKLPYMKMILKLAWRCNKYRNDKEKFSKEKDILLLKLLLFKEFKLIPEIRKLEKSLIEKQIDIKLLDPLERVFIADGKIKVEKAKEKDFSTHREIETIRPRHKEKGMF